MAVLQSACWCQLKRGAMRCQLLLSRMSCATSVFACLQTTQAGWAGAERGAIPVVLVPTLFLSHLCSLLALQNDKLNELKRSAVRQRNEARAERDAAYALCEELRIEAEDTAARAAAAESTVRALHFSPYPLLFLLYGPCRLF